MKQLLTITLILFSLNVLASQSNSHYSPLTQINLNNVKKLKVAWVYHTGDMSKGTKAIAQTTFELTPTFFQKTLYLCTPFNRVVALNPTSGKKLWSYNPKLDKEHLEWGSAESNLVCRGVAAWTDPKSQPGQTCHTRIFTATQDARLISLDAKTGKLCKNFGINGTVDLRKGVVKKLTNDDLNQMHVPPEFQQLMPTFENITYSQTSAPVIIHGLIILGSAISDNVYTKMPHGVVRAFDAKTGELVWTFNPIPKAMRDITGAANVWGPISVDPKNNLVLLGTSSPSVDFYGGTRKEKVPYADAVVALNATTGKPIWHFQTVHHDIYDYDLPTSPALATIDHGGQSIPAAIQPTKTGMIFIFNRLTGTPLFPIVEKNIPASPVKGEQASKTQPEPVMPKPFFSKPLTDKDMFGLVYFDKRWCINKFHQYYYKGLFTPPTTQGSIEFPMTGGGMNWSGVSYDPNTNLLIVNYSRVAHIIKLIPRALADTLPISESVPMIGTPYGISRKLFMSPLGIPCIKPPWGKILAINMDSGKVIWQHPIGTVKKWFFHSFKSWGSPTIGGSLLTKGGLIFIGANMNNQFYAFNTMTGKEVWHHKIPAMAAATPMTYTINGKQYIIIAAGGGMKAPKDLVGDSVVAFALK